MYMACAVVFIGTMACAVVFIGTSCKCVCKMFVFFFEGSMKSDSDVKLFPFSPPGNSLLLYQPVSLYCTNIF